MRCPKCATDLSVGGLPYDLRKGCPACGWTLSAKRDTRPHKTPQFAASTSQWIGACLMSFVFVLGPWFFIACLNPEWFTDRSCWAAYGAGWLIYLLAALFLSPYYDRRNMGLFGGRIDHPLTYSDHWNRLEWVLSILLAPGKVVLAALLNPARVALAFLLGAGDKRQHSGERK